MLFTRILLLTARSTPKKQTPKKTNRLVFSPKPEEVFEYPREEDYESEEDITSDYEEEEEDEEGSPEEPREEEEAEVEEEANEVIEKDIDESEYLSFLHLFLILCLLYIFCLYVYIYFSFLVFVILFDERRHTTNPAVFFPFPSLSNLPAEAAPAPPPQEPIVENPLVKIFSPTIPPSQPDFGNSDSPLLSHPPQSSSPSPSSPSPSESPQQHNNKPHPPTTAPPSHKANGTPPPSHPNGTSPRQSHSPNSSSSNLSIKTDSSSSLPSQQSPTNPPSPSQTHFPGSPRGEGDIPTTVSVRELRSMWENPKGVNTSASRIK